MALSKGYLSQQEWDAKTKSALSFPQWGSFVVALTSNINAGKRLKLNKLIHEITVLDKIKEKSSFPVEFSKKFCCSVLLHSNRRCLINIKLCYFVLIGS